MRTLLQDLQYAGRQMVKSPGFAVIAILTLALGIGANTAIFSVVNGVLLHPLPYPEADRLVVLFHQKPNFTMGSISYLNFLDWQRDNRSFDSMVAYRFGNMKLTGEGEAENLSGRMVSAGFFETLGVKPLRGRTFTSDEDRPGANPTVMISQGLWQRKFGSNPNVIGKAIILDGKARTIIGIIPASFQLQQWNFHPGEIYTAVGEYNDPNFRKRQAAWGLDAIARLKPGVTLAQAGQDMERVNRGLQAAYPDVDAGIKTNIVPMKDLIVGNVRPVLWVLMGAVLFVLLIACVNVANLQLARATVRQREFAVRMALGAPQTRLLRQALTESLALSFVGAAVGLVLAYWCAKGAAAALPDVLPRAENIGLSAPVLLFTLLVTMLAGVIFGLAPALKVSRTDVNATLNQNGRSLIGAHARAQAVFVTLETAMALILLVGAGLMIRTLMQLWNVSPGFDAHNVIYFNMKPSKSLSTRPPDAVRATYRQFKATLSAIPGVESASFDWGAVPMLGDDEEPFWIEGMTRPERVADAPIALRYGVNPDYLKLMHIPLLEGRFFTEADNERTSRVIVIDEGFARRYFHGQDPIGKHVYFPPESTDGERTDEVVGVVGHVKQFGLAPDKANDVEAEYYEPFAQLQDRMMPMLGGGADVFVRLRDGVNPEAVVGSIRSGLRQFDSEMVVDDVEPMQQVVADSIARQRFAMMLFSAFAAGALLLAGIGIYGVLSYIVGQRTREVGIRMALGAQKSNVVGTVLRDGFRMTLPGVGIGLVAALGLTRLMSAILFGVTPTDVVTFATVAVLLCAVALLACYVPARRAAALDPMQALRAE
jgi:predicted permease